MASLNIDALLEAITEEAPCGENLEYDAFFTAMEIEARGTPEKQVGSNIEPAQPPNWKTLRKMILELLERTRDLRLLVELARTDLNLEGLSGLRDAFALLRKSLENYWDSIHPQLDPDDDNDPTARINVLTVLCDSDCFLSPLLNAPLVDSRVVGRFSLRDVQLATGKIPVPSGQTAPQLSLIQGAFSEVPPESITTTHEVLKDSLSDINAIENLLNQQIGVGDAPNFAPIRDILTEAMHFVAAQMDGAGLSGGTQGDQAETDIDSQRSSGGSGANKPTAGQVTGINNRQDVVHALDLICEYYAKNEPSSPVPILARRAKRLVTMDFMEIIQDLAPAGVNEVEIFKGPEPG